MLKDTLVVSGHVLLEGEKAQNASPISKRL